MKAGIPEGPRAERSHKMAVRPSLNHKPTQKAATPLPAGLSEETSTAEATRRPRSTTEGYRPPSRQGKRAAVAWLEPEAIKQLNMYAIQHDRNVQDVLVEAINDWFAKEGLPRFDAENRDAGKSAYMKT
jgi:hypothetical protein